MCLIGIILVWFDRKCKYYCLLFPKKLLTLLNINRDWLILAWLWETYFKIHWSRFEKNLLCYTRKDIHGDFLLMYFFHPLFNCTKRILFFNLLLSTIETFQNFLFTVSYFQLRRLVPLSMLAILNLIEPPYEDFSCRRLKN